MMKCSDCGFAANEGFPSLVSEDISGVLNGYGGIVARCPFCWAWEDRNRSVLNMPAETRHLNWCLNALYTVLASRIDEAGKAV